MSAKQIFAWLLLATAAVAPFLLGLPYAFVYDDHGVIEENAFLDDPGAPGRLLRMDTLGDPDVIDGQRPAVIATYLADRFAWGLWPPGYRLTNLLLHALNTVLLLVLFRRLLPDIPAVIGALLFAWHPLVVEAVQSPAFREDPLYLLGGLLFLVAATRPVAAWRAMVAALAGLLLSLLSKEAAMVFPALLAAVWWLYPHLRPPVRWRFIAMTGALLLTAGLFAVIADGRSLQSLGTVWNGLSLRGNERFWTSPWLAVQMFGRLIFPVHLSVDYPVAPVTSPLDPAFLGGAMLLAGAAFAVWRARLRHPSVSLALLWMLVLYLPVSNLVPLFNPIADRYAYGVIPGFVLLIASQFYRHGAGRILLGAMLAGFVLLTCNRIPDWKNDRTLWQSALEVEPESARAHTWVGLLDKADGKVEEARTHFEQAEWLNPHDPAPTINLAVLLAQQGDLAGAEQRLRLALALRPDSRPARDNLVLCLNQQGRYEEAARIAATGE